MLDVTDIIQNEGRKRFDSVQPELSVLCYSFGEFPVKKAGSCTLQIEHRENQILAVTGRAELEIEIPCDRCLTPVTVRLQICPEVEIDLNDSEYIDGYYLDVDLLLHDEALLVWPERTLCRRDCRGLCPNCGKNLNEGPCSCDTVSLDPRMAKILDIFKNEKEV